MATRPVPRGVEIDDDACNALDGIIAKATQVTPAHRYVSVQALVDQVPDLWISVRPRPKAGPVLPETTAATVLPAALELARTNDLLGWRQLQNQLRRDFVERILPWRKERESKWPGDRNKEGGVAYTDSLLEFSMGRLIFGLAGVYSNNAALADQRQVVEDLLSVPDWNRGGTTAIIEAPRTLVFLFQYLHGALCMAYKQPDLALQLARMAVPDPDRADTWPLWRDHGLVGWPKLLGGTCDWAWEYLCSVRDRQPILAEFFPLKSDYEGALAAYSMLIVMHEVADDASSATPEALGNPDNFRLDFPPLFVGMSREVLTVAARQTLRNKQVVDRVAAQALTRADVMQKLWPARRKAIFRWGSEVFHRHYYDADRDNPIPKELGLASS
jgi:hypothetical protein